LAIFSRYSIYARVAAGAQIASSLAKPPVFSLDYKFQHNWISKHASNNKSEYQYMINNTITTQRQQSHPSKEIQTTKPTTQEVQSITCSNTLD
jgi:hypothetical protein